jgi:hypothetical protein
MKFGFQSHRNFVTNIARQTNDKAKFKIKYLNYELNNNMYNHIEKYFSFAVWNEVCIQVRDKANFVVVNQVGGI